MFVLTSQCFFFTGEILVDIVKFQLEQKLLICIIALLVSENWTTMTALTINWFVKRWFFFLKAMTKQISVFCDLVPCADILEKRTTFTLTYKNEATQCHIL